MLASFAFLGVSIKFTCVDKLGITSKQPKRFSEASIILLDGEFCIYGMSITDM